MRRNRKVVLGAVLALMAVPFVCDLRPSRIGGTAVEVDSFRSSEGSFEVGAARVALGPRLPASVAGYASSRAKARSLATPLFARALVLWSAGEGLALVSVDLLEIPSAIVDRVRRRARALGLADVVVGATHAHSSLGGFEANLFGQIAAMGRYDSAIAEGLEEVIIESVAAALVERRPASLVRGVEDLALISENRAWKGGAVDPRLTLFAFVDGDRRPIGALVFFGAHPTMIPRDAEGLDGDYPARSMETFERGGGVALFFQGAVGDVRAVAPPGPGERVDRVASEIAAGATRAFLRAERLPSTLRRAAAEIELPLGEVDAALPLLLERVGANVVEAIFEDRARVSVVELGGVRILFTPAEVTVAAAEELRRRTGSTEEAVVVSVADGYVGYLELPERFVADQGEAPRALFGPKLLEAVAEGLATCERGLSRSPR